MVKRSFTHNSTLLLVILVLDSCTNVKIEDCYIVSGDDCVAV